MDRTCSNCRATVPEGSTACPSCGEAFVAKKRVPVWVWIVVGVGCGCPLAIVAIGIVATLVVPNVLDRYRTSSRAKATVDITGILNALNEYAIRNGGEYPESLDMLVVPDSSGYTYLNTTRVPRDPWKHEYRYEPPLLGAEDREPHVWSNGRDGMPGGDDDIDSRTMND